MINLHFHFITGGATMGTVVGASIGCLILGTVTGGVVTLVVSRTRQKAPGILIMKCSYIIEWCTD